ncbi:MAG: hypothetical protein WA890_03280 [Micromonospora sp.]
MGTERSRLERTVRRVSLIALACLLLLGLLQAVPAGRGITRVGLWLAFAVYLVSYLVRLGITLSRARRTRQR